MTVENRQRLTKLIERIAHETGVKNMPIPFQGCDRHNEDYRAAYHLAHEALRRFCDEAWRARLITYRKQVR